MATSDANGYFKGLVAAAFGVGAGMATYAAVMTTYYGDHITSTSTHDYEEPIMQFGEIGSYILVAVFGLLLVQYATKGFTDFKMAQSTPQNALISGILLLLLVVGIVQGSFYTMARDEDSEHTKDTFDHLTTRLFDQNLELMIFFIAIGLLPVAHTGITGGGDNSGGDMIDKLFGTLGSSCAVLFGISYVTLNLLEDKERLFSGISTKAVYFDDQDYNGQRSTEKVMLALSCIFAGVASLSYLGLWFKRGIEMNWASMYRITFMALGLGAAALYLVLGTIQHYEEIDLKKDLYADVIVWNGGDADPCVDAIHTVDNYYTTLDSATCSRKPYVDFYNALKDHRGKHFYEASTMFLPVRSIPDRRVRAFPHVSTALPVRRSAVRAQRDVEPHDPRQHVRPPEQGHDELRPQHDGQVSRDHHVLGAGSGFGFDVNTHCSIMIGPHIEPWRPSQP